MDSEGVTQHEAIDQPSWNTKIVCTCGERCTNWMAFYKHRGDAYLVQLTAQSTMVEVTEDELSEQIAIGVHTGLRKGSEAPSSHDLWQAISRSDDSAWSDAADYCADGLRFMGYKVMKPVTQ